MSPCCSACARRACRIIASRISPAPNSPCRRSDIPFLSGFDGIVVSGDERLLKPDPAIYRLLLDRYGLEAEDCVFIDDSKANVEGAREVGMHAIHCVEPIDLAAELRGYGFPV